MSLVLSKNLGQKNVDSKILLGQKITISPLAKIRCGKHFHFTAQSDESFYLCFLQKLPSAEKSYLLANSDVHLKSGKCPVI